MAESWRHLLGRWTDAGLIDAASAARIQAFEEERAGTARLQRPIWISLAFGALLLGAGVMLFVSAHWDALSPTGRFSLVLLLVALFHASAAAAAARFAWLATTLAALGTVSLGAGIFLTGQIFNLEAHWPAGLMLWTAGAAIAWALLRDAPQMALFAILAPAWLCGEWVTAIGPAVSPGAVRLAAAGVFLLAIVYFTAPGDGRPAGPRRLLWWLGGIALPLAAIALATSGAGRQISAAIIPMNLWAIGWTVALGTPVLLAGFLHRTNAWTHALTVLWAVGEINVQAHFGTWALYAWWAIGAVALAAWGVRDGRTERVNMASAMFAGTVLAFYFSQVMDKLGRSASLIGLGVLFLAGGWALEQVRRHLVQTTRGART